MVNTELLIFSLISLIILIPIIYFLPLNLTKKGKMTVLAVSFLIAIAGLLTKVFMQLWQSVLLLIGLILLLSMILTKKFSPVLFSASNSSSNEMDSDAHVKDTKAADFKKMESLPVMPSDRMNETAGVKSEPIDLQEPEDKTIVLPNNEEYMINELDDLQAFEKSEDKGNDVIYPSEDAFFSPTLQSAAAVEQKSPLPHLEPVELEELAPIELAEQSEAENEEMAVNEDLSYLGELEELMLESQAEVAAASETLEEPETEMDPVCEQKNKVYSDDAADIETLLNSQVEEEFERDEDMINEAEVEGDLEPISTVAPVLNELPEEELQVVYNEEMELEEAVNEASVLETAPENTMEDVQNAVQEAASDGNLPVNENTIAELEYPVLPFAEQQDPMEALEEVPEVAEETAVLPEESPAPAEVNNRTIEHREVFETLLLQAEIAKKMKNKEQFEHIVESFLNYDDSEDERNKMLKTLLKDYINIMK